MLATYLKAKGNPLAFLCTKFVSFFLTDADYKFIDIPS